MRGAGSELQYRAHQSVGGVEEDFPILQLPGGGWGTAVGATQTLEVARLKRTRKSSCRRGSVRRASKGRS